MTRMLENSENHPLKWVCSRGFRFNKITSIFKYNICVGITFAKLPIFFKVINFSLTFHELFMNFANFLNFPEGRARFKTIQKGPVADSTKVGRSKKYCF